MVELAIGRWLARFEGEESDPVIDRSPDQALACLIRANIRRLGIEQISYAVDLEEAESTGETDVKPSHGTTLLPLGTGVIPERKKSS